MARCKLFITSVLSIKCCAVWLVSMQGV